MNPFFTPKNIQKLKVVPEKNFFFLEACLESGKNTDLAVLLSSIFPFFAIFPWNYQL
jgi:hypothetical protein